MRAYSFSGLGVPSLLFFCLWVAPISVWADTTRTIPNSLGEQWKLEHVSFDFPAGEMKEPLNVTVQGISRPGQVERVVVDGKETDRIWTVVTIAAKDDAGQPLADPKNNPALKKVAAVFKPGPAESVLAVKEEGDFYVVSNTYYNLKIRNYKKGLGGPTPLEKVPHWLGGIQVKGTEAWDARAYFEGNSIIREVKTEIVAQGPVYIDFKITLTGDQTVPTEMVEAIPLVPGKQSFRFKPAEIPREKVPRYQSRYEAMVRVVLEDPWIDVSERAYFPRDPAIKPWGFNQAIIDFGGKEGIPIDTAMWVRWFEWDIFGGNTDILFAPAAMRPAQKGKPFAMLRPIWNQGGGGAQDFFLTSGGATPAENAEPNPATGYTPENAAVGVFAAFPSKWVGPFAQTIVARAENGNSGSLRFPLVPADVKDLHYGQRAYGLCAGPRKLFDNTGKMNGMLRRHSDWTLNALINRYRLEWDRDPSKAGPNLLINRQKFEALQKDYQSGANTPEMAIIKEAWADIPKQQASLDSLRAEIKKQEDAAKTLPEPEKKAANEKIQVQRDEAKKMEKALGSDESVLVRLIVEGKGKDPGLPQSGLFRERRYQDDFLNPTSRAVRAMVNIRFADLFAGGKPLGGADVAAMGYIVTDPDYWMGWRNGWMPGNPNFHTDKYAAALYIAGALRDHPDSPAWIEYARKNYLEDLDLVLLSPDGVGVECPGYAGYAMHLMLPMGLAFDNLGYEGILADHPMVKKTGLWHRDLLTPVDARIGRRHEAPIGDTHRWDEGLGSGFGLMARLFKSKDPAFAAEMMSIWRLLENSGVKSEGSPVLRKLLTMDYSLPEVPLDKMDWSSRPFFGFGAILRDGFGTPQESFLTLKAGRISGHYHNDENSFHYYADSTPIALDYNCSYSPRGDHAALHNSMTFGKKGEVQNNQKNTAVEAMEQLFGQARVGYFVSKPEADLVVSERTGTTLAMTPIRPDDAEFSREYPSRKIDPTIHRRMLMFVKHGGKGSFTDYLVVRDETQSKEPQQMNLHLLARNLKMEGNRVDARGQLGMDMSVYFAEAANPKMEDREWFYCDPYMFGPEEYTLREGETFADWDKRMAALAKSSGGGIPAQGFKPSYKNAQKNETLPWLQQIQKTKGQALIPPDGWKAPWTYGEYQKWLRVETDPGTPILWVLYPYRRGTEPPKFESIPEGVKVTVGGKTEEVKMNSAGGASVTCDGKTTVLLGPNSLPDLGKIEDKPLAP